jgi:hypothetical protein
VIQLLPLAGMKIAFRKIALSFGLPQERINKVNAARNDEIVNFMDVLLTNVIESKLFFLKQTMKMSSGNNTGN